MPNPESLLGGKYRIVRPLGEGGMGTVFEVENLLTQKRAAIKWLHPRFQSGEGFAKRMLREARAMARIRHQNVVDVYDVLLDDDNICVVMELLQGELLSDRLASAPISIADFLTLLLPAMRGVAAAHAVGVVHRDIKPDNIFLATENGQAQPTPKVIDFGISKVFNAEDDRSTCSGVTMGTPRYVSYEQLRGLRDVDGRTDIYAFGVILFEALTGNPPYAAESLGQQAIQFVTSVPPPVRSLRPTIPEKLAKSVERAISRDRDHRHESLSELVDELSVFTRSDSFLYALSAFPSAPPLAETVAPELVDASRTTLEASSLAPASNQAIQGALAQHARLSRPAIGVVLMATLGASLTWAALAAQPPIAARAPITRAADLPTSQVETASAGRAQLGALTAAKPGELASTLTSEAASRPNAPPPEPAVPRRPHRAPRRAVAAPEAPLESGAGSPAIPPAVSNEEEPDPSPARSGRLTRSEF